MFQSTNKLAIVKPLSFGFDQNSAKTNCFQTNKSQENLLKLVINEHLKLKQVLYQNNIDFEILNSPKGCLDGIFPNNWVITYADNTYDLFSMHNPNRRLERSKDNIDFLQKTYKLENDYSIYEKNNKFLEGTGSLVLDRVNKMAYLSSSERSCVELANQWSLKRGYTLEVFSSYLNKQPVYHTNVLMFIGSEVACIGSDLIRNNDVESLLQKHHRVIRLSENEVRNFCGNCLEVRDINNNKILLMSSRAYRNFSSSNLHDLKNYYYDVIHTDISNIEDVGGGSLRCMLLELF